MHNKQFNSALDRKVDKAIALSVKRVKTSESATQAHKMPKIVIVRG